MADEIIELSREPRRKGLLAFKVLYYYPMEAPIVVRGTPMPLSPRETLPAGVEALGLLHPDSASATARLAALDAGEAYFKVEDVEQKPGEPLGQVLARAQARYPKGLQHIARQRIRYEHTGESHDAT